MPVPRSNTLFFNKRKSTGFDWLFMDGQIRQKLYAGGTDVNVYTYTGVHDQFKDVTDGSNIAQVFTGSPPKEAWRSPLKAFDDSNETYYETLTVPTAISQEFIQLDMGSDDAHRIIINGVGLNGFGVGTLPQIVEFFGSDDGITWDILSVITTTTSDDLQRFDVDNDIAYRMFKFVAMNPTHNIAEWKVESIELYSEAGETGIQDKFFLENRDRSYNSTPIPMLCWYDIPEKPHDLGMWGFGIPTDQIELTLLISDTKTALSRAMMAGDMVSLPHLGDNSNDEGGPDNGERGKLYEVVDVQIAADGYDRRWRDHLYRIIAAPAKARQETYDITGEPNAGFIDLTAPHPLVTQDADIALNNEITREAEHAGQLGLDTTNISGESIDQFTHDGIPNDGSPYTIGTDFPMAPTTGEYFLHEGYDIPKLYNWDGFRWIVKERAYRQTLGGQNTERGAFKKMLASDDNKPLDEKD